ncbi:hypothetical protein PG993_008824 [Apiospora rasikravindrae]|uniref:Uncharacterized protein n=1 Tax=Apiospora rasikravindrae TaxID=990691 RepID=A0ABR1SPE8_9PEZI
MKSYLFALQLCVLALALVLPGSARALDTVPWTALEDVSSSTATPAPSDPTTSFLSLPTPGPEDNRAHCEHSSCDFDPEINECAPQNPDDDYNDPDYNSDPDSDGPGKALAGVSNANSRPYTVTGSNGEQLILKSRKYPGSTELCDNADYAMGNDCQAKRYAALNHVTSTVFSHSPISIGIDECNSNVDVLRFIQDVLPTRPKTRFLLSSRVNVPRLKHLVSDHLHLEFSTVSVSNDLTKFFTSELRRLQDQAMLPRAPESLKPLVHQLVRGADGMFLWARLMISFLESPTMTRRQRVEVIEKVTAPEGLENLVTNRVWIDQYLSHGLHCIISDIEGAFIDAARCCLLGLTRKKEQQTACDNVNSTSDPATQDMANRFVVHAAPNMLNYLEDAALSTKSVENLHVHVRSAIREALTHLLPILSDFVNKPLLLSRWLFDLYESKPLGHPRCTAMSAFAHWIRQHWSRDMVVNENLLHALVTFDRELDRIVAHWGNSLQQRPDIIWDDMASFSNSQLFYNPGSTRISYQDVSAPTALGIWSKPVTTVSKTTPSGDMKGVLSIWSTLPLKSLRTSQHVNMSVLCKGWVAKYELWSIEAEPKVRFSAELPIDEQEILLTLRCWLSHPFPDQFWFPTAISDNVQSFSVLKTVFTLRTARREGEYQWLSQHVLGRLQPPAAIQLDMTRPCQYSYSVHLSPDGSRVAISEATNASPTQFSYGPQIISIYGIPTRNLPSPAFVLENCLEFGAGAEVLRNIIFHPTQTAIAIKACSRDVGEVRKWYTYIHMWDFKREYPASITSYQISSEREVVRTMNFSACGSYFTATTESGRCEPIRDLSVGNIDGNDKLIIDSSRVTNSLSPLVSLRGSSIMLEKAAGDNTHMNAELVRLPPNLCMEQTSLQVSLPREAGDAIGINIDATPAKLTRFRPRCQLRCAQNGSAPQAAIDSSFSIIPKGKQAGKRTMTDSELEQHGRESKKTRAVWMPLIDDSSRGGQARPHSVLAACSRGGRASTIGLEGCAQRSMTEQRKSTGKLSQSLQR